jgi:hypothetical protein
MTDIRISLDESQLLGLREALIRPSPSFWQSEGLLRVAQVLALAVGGCWVLIQFLLYQRDEIQLKREELTQSVKLKELEVQLSDLKRARDTHDLATLTTYRFSDEANIEVRRLGSAGAEKSMFEVTYSITLKNIADESFEVSLWVLDYFIGVVDKNLAKSAAFVKPISWPSNRWNPGIVPEGAVKWTKAGSQGAITAVAEGHIASPWNDYVNDVDLTIGGILTGTVKPEQTNSFRQTFLVKAPSDGYIAFLASICFNRCVNNDDLYGSTAQLKLSGDDEVQRASKPVSK